MPATCGHLELSLLISELAAACPAGHARAAPHVVSGSWAASGLHGFPHVLPEYKWLYNVPPHEGVKGRWAGIQDSFLLRDGCVKGWPPLHHGDGRGLESSAPNRSPTSRDGFLQLLLHGGVKGW